VANFALSLLTAVILGALLLDEPLTLAMCLGGGLILAGISCATNPLRTQGKRGFDTEGGQIDLRCVESGYAYKNNRLLAAEASPVIALGRQ